MATYGQKKLNKSEVQNGLLRFILSFIALLFVCFLIVFLFFTSYQHQQAEIKKDVEKYKNAITKNQLLYLRVDSLYNKMNQTNRYRVRNEKALYEDILKDVNSMNLSIGVDSVGDFKQYAMLLKNIEKMADLKADINLEMNKLDNIKKELNRCTNADRRVQNNINVDPSRIYQGNRGRR